MRWLKSYSKYQESIVIDIKFQSIDLSESLSIDWHDVLLDSISAEEVDLFDEFNMKKEDYEDKSKLDLNFLGGEVGKKAPYDKFVNALIKKDLKISEVNNSENLQTFLNKPCKFMFIYKNDQNELENPVYILFQVLLKSSNEWTTVKLYKIGGDVNDFYAKLSSRTIKITDDDVDYIYFTSNGNEWELKNKEETDKYKKVLRKEELEEFIDSIKNDSSEKNIKLTII